jgi:hypothetical protein
VEEEVQGKICDWRLMRRLLVYARPYWGVVAVSVALMLAASVLHVAGQAGQEDCLRVGRGTSPILIFMK